jgi:hypothetical protein
MLHALAALVLLVGVLPSPAAPDAVWSWPVDPPRAVVRAYVAPLTPYSAGHRGIDIRAPAAPVRAPAAGIVHFAGVVVDRPVLSIRHPGGVISSFEPVESELVEGEAVARGDPIGTLLPGHCSATCLHMGVRVDGEYVSPLRYLGGIPRAVLLPTRWSAVPALAQVDADAPAGDAAVAVGSRRRYHEALLTVEVIASIRGGRVEDLVERRREQPRTARARAPPLRVVLQVEGETEQASNDEGERCADDDGSDHGSTVSR